MLKAKGELGLNLWCIGQNLQDTCTEATFFICASPLSFRQIQRREYCSFNATKAVRPLNIMLVIK